MRPSVSQFGFSLVAALNSAVPWSWLVIALHANSGAGVLESNAISDMCVTHTLAEMSRLGSVNVLRLPIFMNRVPFRVQLSWFGAAMLFIAGAIGLAQDMLDVPFRHVVAIPPKKLVHEGGFSFSFASGALKNQLATTKSRVAGLLENGRMVNQKESLLADIASLGGGRYAFKHGRILHLSSIDGTDPKTNGRTYAVAVAWIPPSWLVLASWLALVLGAGRLVTLARGGAIAGDAIITDTARLSDAGSSMVLSIQILRGIAAWLVVFFHWQIQWTCTDSVTGAFLGKYGMLGVDIFFVISGFIMKTVTSEACTSSGFLRNRVTRIVPAYWFFTLALAGLALTVPAIGVMVPPEWAAIWRSLVFGFFDTSRPPYLGVGWTLVFEMFFYCIVSLALCFLRARSAFAVVAVLFFLSPMMWSKDWIFGGILSEVLIAEFSIGIVIGFFARTRVFARLQSTGWVGCAVLVMAGLGAFACNAPWATAAGAGCVVLAFVANDSQLRRLVVAKPMIVLGTISYSTYLCHAPVIWLSFGFGRGVCFHVELLALFAAMTAAVVIISLISHRFIESGLTRWLKKATRGTPSGRQGL